MNLKEKKTKTKTLLEYKFLNIYEDTVLLPNNEQSTRIYIKHPGAASVLPILSTGEICLIKQFRYPINRVMIETPAGKIDPGESSFDCAKRELIEETGLTSDRFEFILGIHNCVGYSDEVIDCYIAYDCELSKLQLDGDADEFIERFIVTKEEAKELLSKKEITDAKTVILLQHYLK
jgi:ADP-ribose pyrophosphatase